MNCHIHWSQLRVRLVKMETCQVPPVLSRVTKSTTVCSLQRPFHPVDSLQVSLSLWKSQTLPLPSASLWGSLHGRVGGPSSSHCANMLSQPQMNLLRLQCSLFPHSSRRVVRCVACLLSLREVLDSVSSINHTGGTSTWGI